MDNEIINPNNRSDQRSPGSLPSSPSSLNFSPPSPGQPSAPSFKQPAKKKRKPVLLIVIVVLLLAAIGLGYVLVNRNLKETDTSTAQETGGKLAEVAQIRIATTDGPANNLFPKEGIGISYSQSRQIYEGLVGLQDKKYVPLLAESWTNPDEKTWQFKLKSGVKFHTGKTLTADDVKKSIDALKKLDFIGYVHSTIASVEVINDLEVKITTKEPDALLLNRLTLAYVTDNGAVDKVGNNGTGPYRLDIEAKYDTNNATLIANDNYYKGRPLTRKLVYTVYETDEQLNAALKDDRADMIETIPDKKAIAGLDEAGFAKISYEAPGSFGLFMNMKRADSPLRNKDLRTAIALAVDRVSLVEELANSNEPATQVIPKSLPGYDASIRFPEFSLSAAKASLQKSGLAGTKLDYLYASDVQPDPPVIIKQLERAGLKINAVNYTDTKELLDKIYAGDFDLFSGAYTSDLSDSRDLMGALLETKEQSYPVLNDKKFDSILELSDKELDPTKRIKLLQQANKYITDNILWIPLRNTVYVSYFKPGLSITHDFNGGGALGVYYWQVGQKAAN